jgi:hypothetical protein
MQRERSIRIMILRPVHILKCQIWGHDWRRCWRKGPNRDLRLNSKQFKRICFRIWIWKGKVELSICSGKIWPANTFNRRKGTLRWTKPVIQRKSSFLKCQLTEQSSNHSLKNKEVELFPDTISPSSTEAASIWSQNLRISLSALSLTSQTSTFNLDLLKNRKRFSTLQDRLSEVNESMEEWEIRAQWWTFLRKRSFESKPKNGLNEDKIQSTRRGIMRKKEEGFTRIISPSQNHELLQRPT